MTYGSCVIRPIFDKTPTRSTDGLTNMTLLTIDANCRDNRIRRTAIMDGGTLLAAVRSQHPTAEPREIARAALYVATDPDPPSVDVSATLFNSAMELRREL
jgi:hypothetical protein